MCSYTLIPKDGGKEIELNIRHCTFIDKVLDEIVARTAECDELEKMETGELWYDLGADFFQVYGPFASSDYTIANTRRVAVLVQSTGSTVSESVIKFQNLRRYWEKVIVVVVGSDLMDYQPEVPSRGRLSSLVFENTNVVGFKRNEAKYRWVMNRIEREIFYRGRRRPCEIVRKSNGETYLTPPESKKKWNHFTTGLSKSEKAKLLCSESAALYPNSVIMRNFDIKEDVGSEHDIVVFGFQRLQTELAEHILKNLQMNDFDMIVCSGVWLQHIQTILEKDKNSVDPEIHLEKTKLHMELFDC
uniref:Uncharacterized protein n=1 Tax=Amorphochlora amoebiformis TaxID=1561963 RepID=A0A7S0GTN1_9EUKA|mmetsp:Transcript_20213/g.32067  ORF Transcript_20213/g.32067 Transcript_20213/m.32067 type:complete len:302 (+) Transcript_20213:2-907(+)